MKVAMYEENLPFRIDHFRNCSTPCSPTISFEHFISLQVEWHEAKKAVLKQLNALLPDGNKIIGGTDMFQC